MKLQKKISRKAAKLAKEKILYETTLKDMILGLYISMNHELHERHEKRNKSVFDFCVFRVFRGLPHMKTN